MRTTPITVHVVIPARWASERLPGKPLVPIGNKPLIVRVFDVAKSAFPTANPLVAIDNAQVELELSKRGIPFIMTHPDHNSGTDRIAEVCEKTGWNSHDIVVNLQGDEPLVPPLLLTQFIDFCRKLRALEMATISAPIASQEEVENPNVVKLVTNSSGNACYFSRSAIPYVRNGDSANKDLSIFRRHIGIYAYRVETLLRLSRTPVAPTEQAEKLEQLRALWSGVSIAVMDWHDCPPPHGVDTPADVHRVARIFEKETKKQ